MRPIEYVRKHILKLTQAELAAVANTTQPTVSCWESGKLEPSLTQLSLIRQHAISRGLLWNDAVFFQDAPEMAS